MGNPHSGHLSFIEAFQLIIMSYILNTVRPANLQNWISVNSIPSIRATPRESWKAYLANNGAVGQSTSELEFSFLTAQPGNTLADKWGSYLTAQAGDTTRQKARNLYI